MVFLYGAVPPPVLVEGVDPQELGRLDSIQVHVSSPRCLPLDDDIIPEARLGLAVIGFALDMSQRCFHAVYVCTYKPFQVP